MTARDCVRQAAAAGPAYQRIVNLFIDGFRSGGRPEREAAVADPIETSGPVEGLVAAVVSALCRETGARTPNWVADVGSPVPFFAFPATSYEMRVRLMIDSPPASESATCLCRITTCREPDRVERFTWL